MNQRIFWINIKYACFGIVSKNDIVVEAAPIARWMIGKDLKSIKPWLLQRGAIVKEITNLS